MSGLANTGGVRVDGPESVLPYLMSNDTPPQVDDNPVFDDAVGNLESHLALSPLLFFRVAATAELPARQSFALGAHELLARKAGLHELSVATTTRHQRLSTTTTHDLKLANSFTMVIPTARAILDIGGSADGWI